MYCKISCNGSNLKYKIEEWNNFLIEIAKACYLFLRNKYENISEKCLAINIIRNIEIYLQSNTKYNPTHFLLFFENNKFDRNKKYGEVLIEHGMIGIPILLTKYKLNSNLSIGNAKDIIDSFDLIKDFVDYEYSNYLSDIINICNESIENNLIITIDYLHDDSSKKTN